MRRILQAVSGLLALIAVFLVWRIVEVSRIEAPTFEDPPALSADQPLPPPPRPPGPLALAVDAIVDGNLFETDRGASEDTADAEAAEEPLPPPTNVVLNGVFFHNTGRPMAIMTDTNAGNRQLTLQVGDNVGDYQVGEITRDRVTLLGRGGQQFSLELNIAKGGAAPVRRPPTPGRPATATRARPAPATAAQTAAQRAAAARRQQQARARAAAQNRPAAQPAGRDPTQERLEALRRLREAASAR